MISRTTSIVTAAVFAIAASPACCSAKGAVVSEAVHIYNEAEQWFHEWEANNHATPLEPVTLIRDGFFHRCYQLDVDKVCFGVAVGNTDGFLWKQINDGQWMIEMPLQSTPNQLAIFIGKLRGNLANDLMEYLSKATGPARKEATAVVLGEGALTNENKDTIRRAYRANHAIILLNATANEIARLQQLLKLTGFDRLPDSIRMLDAFALKMDDDGDVRTVKVMRPVKLHNSITTEIKTDDSGTADTRLEKTQVAEDSDALQAIRTGELMELLRREAPQKDLSSQTAMRAEIMGAEDKFEKLEDTMRSFEGHMIFQFRNNIHNLTTNVWSIHKNETDEDWFYVRQEGSFSAAGELFGDALTPGNHTSRGRFTEFYSVKTRIEGYEPTSDSIWLLRSSPETTSDITRATSSSEWSLGGELSGTAKCEVQFDQKGKCEVGGGAKLYAGIKQSDSRSFDIRDMNLINTSSGNNASWSFNIAAPYWKAGFLCVGFDGIGELKKLSAGTFQPTLQWFWKVKKDVRYRHPQGLPITVDFQTRVRHIWHYQYGCAGVWLPEESRYSLLTDALFPSGVLTQTMQVPWPAIANK